MNKSEAVIIIRSLLSASKTPIKIFDLKIKFKDVTGWDLPLFEHSSLENFLLSIPDTVTLSGIHPDITVNLVKNEKSNHIVSLVEKQKNSVKKKRDNFHVTRRNEWSPRYNQPAAVDNNYSLKFHQYLLKSPDGLDFIQIKNYLHRFENCNVPLKQYNILNFIKFHPFCIYFNGKFYAIEVFKRKISDNDFIS